MDDDAAGLRTRRRTPARGPCSHRIARSRHPGSTAQARSNGFAIAALILGIVWLCGFGSLMAVIFGHVSLTQIARSEGWEKGRGMALAGLILGYCGLAFIAFVIIASATSYKP